METWSLPLMGMATEHYRYLADLQYLDSCVPATKPFSWPRGPSPVVVEAFELYLRSHPDRQLMQYILQGLTSGFRIGFSHDSHRLKQRGIEITLPLSSLSNAQVVLDYINTKVRTGRLVGPLP